MVNKDSLEGREIRKVRIDRSPYFFTYDPVEDSYAAHLDAVEGHQFGAQLGMSSREINSIVVLLSSDDVRSIEDPTSQEISGVTRTIVVTYAGGGHAEHINFPAAEVMQALTKR